MGHAEPDLCLASFTVVEHREPVRLVTHHPDGTWFMSCGAAEDVDDFTIVHVRHLLDDPLQLLAQVRDLPRGSEAWREDPSYDWEIGPADEE